MTGRWSFRTAAACASFALATTAFAQTYPNRPVRIVVPAATGGPDTIARVLGPQLATQLGQPFVVENRPGANGILGADLVAKAPADGYTLMLYSSGFVVAPSVVKKLPYDTERDFAPVINIASNLGVVVVVNPSVPATTLREFIAFAQKPESKVSFSSPGIGNTLHMIGELFNARAGTKMLHVPYKGGGPAIAAVVSGEVQAMMAPLQLSAPFIKSGRVRALAYSMEPRAPAIPDVPTMAEAGVPDFVVDGGWFGLFAPAGTPPAVVARLNAEVRRSLADPATREKIISLGFGPIGDTVDNFRTFVRDEIRKYAEMARLANIQPE